MDSLGDYFKRTREKKGIALEDIASQTKIQKHHLQALESEDFANLPAKVFVKGFVRSYAKALGLDDEEAVQCFLQASGTFYEQHQPEAPQPHVQIKLEAAPREGLNWNLVIPVIGILIIAAIWIGLPNKQDPPIERPELEVSSSPEPVDQPPLPEIRTKETLKPNSETIQPASEQPFPPIQVPESETVPSEPAPEVLTPIVAAPSPPSSTSKPVDPSRPNSPQILEIEATQLTWVVVKSDEQAPNEALLQPGQRITWKAEEEFQVTLGNAAGVLIRLNGQPQGPFGNPGQVVRNIKLRP